MSQVSKYPIRKEIADRIFEIFIKSLVKVKYLSEAENLASDLFSPTEKVMFAKRLAIAFLLMKGYQYREISQLLKVSMGTIASVNMSVSHGRKGYALILNKISAEEQLDSFFGEFIEKLVSVPASISKGGGSWRYLREEVRKSRSKNSKAF